MFSRGNQLAVFAILFSCAFLLSCSAPALNLARVPNYGFVVEYDEPSTRGQLSRITPTDMIVGWQYTFTTDGKSLLFSGKQNGDSEPFQLYRLDIGSQNPVKITSGGEDNIWDPSYTGDGEYIVYRVANNLWKIRKDGSGGRIKVSGSGTNNDYYPQVSTTNKVVFVTYDAISNRYLIWTIGVDGTELTQYREGNHPCWSPDGQKIAFDYKDDIWIMNSDGTDMTQLTNTKDIIEALPSFSPDGNFICYTSNESAKGRSNDANIWYIGLDGSEKTQVTALNSWDYIPKWTKDGIYFISGRGNESSTFRRKEILRIWRINLK